jgi:hypothetical protein
MLHCLCRSAPTDGRQTGHTRLILFCATATNHVVDEGRDAVNCSNGIRISNPFSIPMFQVALCGLFTA